MWRPFFPSTDINVFHREKTCVSFKWKRFLVSVPGIQALNRRLKFCLHAAVEELEWHMTTSASQSMAGLGWETWWKSDHLSKSFTMKLPSILQIFSWCLWLTLSTNPVLGRVSITAFSCNLNSQASMTSDLDACPLHGEVHIFNSSYNEDPHIF